VVGNDGRSNDMTALAFYIRLEAKPGKEQEVAAFLSASRALVLEEPETTAWFAIRVGPSTCAVFGAFPNERAREAHLKGKVAAGLMAKAPELFANQLDFVKLEVIADKLPH
jgi:quinol monooxygenase YgiN